MQKENCKKIGLLGTQFTLEDGFYHARLMEKFQMDVIVPDRHSRMVLDAIIYNELCVGVFSEESKQILMKIIDSLVEQGAQAGLLGCTELGMLGSRPK